MLTFQIQDGGESYYRPLEERPLTIGRVSGCDVRLQAEGVLDHHATVTCDATQAYHIRGESEDAVLKVNGQRVREAQLALGDRVQLGEAVLVLGQQVRRPATASDVLEQTSSSRTRVRSSSSHTRLFVGVAVLAAAGLALFLSQWSTGASLEVPYTENDLIRRARKGGRFEEGRQVLDKLQQDWARHDAAKQELVDELRRQLEATEREFTRLRAQLAQEVLDKSRIDQLDWLKDLRTSKYPEPVREAATIIAGRLTDYREQDRVKALAKLESRPPSEVSGRGTGKDPDRTGPQKRPGWLDARIAEVRKLHTQKQHARALEMLRQALPDVPVEHAAPLRDLLDEVRQATRTEMEQLVAEAHQLRQEGKLSEAVKLLRAEVMRFPTIGTLAEVYHALCGLEADLELGAVVPRLPVAKAKPVPKDQPRPKRQPKERPNALETGDPAVPRIRRPAPRVVETDYTGLFRGLLVRVEDAERAGDLDAAMARARDGAARLKQRPALAAAMTARAADLAVLADMSKRARGLIKPELGLQVTLADGRSLQVSGMEGHLLVGGGPEEKDRVKVGWLALAPDQAAKVLQAIEMPMDGLLGLAVLHYRGGDPDGAEQLLARLVRKDANLRKQVDGVISRGRGEHVDADGYTLVEGKFVAARFLRVEQLARKIGRRIGQLHNRDKPTRDRILAEILADGDDGQDATALALRAQQHKLIRNIKKSPFQKGHAKVAAVRERLDKARAHALSLIFDTKKYFYPYRPPAVSGDKASEYWKVQKEVNKRVAAVKKIWLHDKTKAVMPKALKRGVEFLRWVNDALTNLGEPVGAEMQQITWIETLPPVKVLTTRNFCKTEREKERFLLETRIEILNETLGEEALSEGEYSQVSITNSYRRMMGRNILAVNPKVHKAARSHAVEMGALGYFGHFSPKPERRSPYQRMRLEGYTSGVSENIAKTASAADAHRRWLHSSGHHRNILMPSHTEFGVGNAGYLWVQNFGMGDEYRNNEHFPPPRQQ